MHLQWLTATAQSRLLAVTGRLAVFTVYIAQLICTDMSSVLVVRKSMLPGGRKQCKLNQKGQYKNLLMKKNRQLYDCRFLQKLQKRGNFKLWNLINVSLEQFPYKFNFWYNLTSIRFFFSFRTPHNLKLRKCRIACALADISVKCAWKPSWDPGNSGESICVATTITAWK